jgi:hypothetical protein
MDMAYTGAPMGHEGFVERANRTGMIIFILPLAAPPPPRTHHDVCGCDDRADGRAAGPLVEVRALHAPELPIQRHKAPLQRSPQVPWVPRPVGRKASSHLRALSHTDQETWNLCACNLGPIAVSHWQLFRLALAAWTTQCRPASGLPIVKHPPDMIRRESAILFRALPVMQHPPHAIPKCGVCLDEGDHLPRADLYHH